MARKALAYLRAEVRDAPRTSPSVVTVSAYKSTPFYGDNCAAVFRSIRVWRMRVDFEFGQDYAEFFDGLSVDNAELIHDGPIEPTNQRKFTFTDTDVRVGETYAYWMAPADRAPTGPAPVKVRDTDAWWSETVLHEEIDELVSRHPQLVHVGTAGHTVRGRALPEVRFGDGPTCIALIGAVHPGEAGPELILGAMESALDEWPDLLARCAVVTLPVVALDERMRAVEGVPWYLRTNANGVDLNRNFPADWDTVEYGYGLDSSDPASATYRGPRPASEPETRAVMAFLKKHRPAVVYSYHALAGICGGTFLAARSAENDAPYAESCAQLASLASRAMALTPDAKPEDALRFACTSGSLPAWCHSELGVPAFDIELPREAPGFGKAVSDRTDWDLLVTYSCRHTDFIYAAARQVVE